MSTTTVDTKPCSMCERILPLSAFNRQKGGSKGRQSRCRECHKGAVLNDYYAKREHYVALMRNRDLLRYFGITADEYEVMLEAQGGVCAICRQPETVVSHRNGKVKRLAVDHCHASSEVRGLLCAACNNGLGRFRDDPELLRAAADYLERGRG